LLQGRIREEIAMKRAGLAEGLLIAGVLSLTACGSSSIASQKTSLDSAIAAYDVPVVISGVGAGKVTLLLPQVLLGSAQTRPITFVFGQPTKNTGGWSVSLDVLNDGGFGAPTGVAADVVDFPASMDATSAEVTVNVAKGTPWAMGVAAGTYRQPATKTP